MSRFFEDWKTEAERPAMKDLIDQVELDLKQTIETQGPRSIEAARLGLILATIHFVMGEYRNADPLIRNYIFAAEEKFGLNSNEVLSGLILLSNNCVRWERSEESRFVLDRVKSVAERCSQWRDPLLEGLYDLAVGCQNADGPTNEQRGFILSLLALSWCIRHQSDTHVYEQFAPRLKSFFEPYGFVGDRWQWLISHCNHNLHDLVGLISILLEKRIFPIEAEPSLTPEMHEKSLTSLLEEFPFPTEGQLRDRILAAGGKPMELKFTCPMCGSKDLRTMFMEPYYPISTLDNIEVDPGNVDLSVLNEREPSEYEGQGHTDGWAFWCDKCHLVPRLEPNDEEETPEESLARWLLDNCPQDDTDTETIQ